MSGTHLSYAITHTKSGSDVIISIAKESGVKIDNLIINLISVKTDLDGK